MSKIVIIGGGLAGLTAAFRLGSRAEVTLLEADGRLGGQILTDSSDGFVIERGAEGFVFRSEAVPALVRDLGMPESDLIAQSVTRSFGYDGQGLRELMPGEAASFLGFQVSREDLGKGIRSLRHGMGSLIEAFERALRERVNVRLRTRVQAIERDGSGLRVRIVGGEAVQTDAVVIATSAVSVAELLSGALGERAAALRTAPTMSSVTIELAYPRTAIAHALDGTGFVVALAEQRDGLRACTFTSSKFVERAPAGKVSLRSFIRPNGDEIDRLDDAAFVERARAALRRVLDVREAPLRAWVSRWQDALPVFTEDHKAQVFALEDALREWPLVLAGSAFHGAGIDAAVRSGEQAARDLPARVPGLRL